MSFKGTQKITIRVARGRVSPVRLDDVITANSDIIALKLSKAAVRKLIAAGVVYMNGKRLKLPSYPLKGGEIIDVYWDPDRAPDVVKAEKFLPLRVLYEDEAIICFDKPAGLPSQPTVDEKRVNLYELAKGQLAHAGGKPAYLGMHHRLDRDTSGVILFTREPKYNSFVADLFSGHKCTKMYVAMVHGRLKNKEGRLESFLAPVGKKGKQSRFGSVRSGGKKAITDYLVLAASDKYSLVKVSITTGRTHQIRVHFSEMGHPIVGDTLYGSPIEEFGSRGRFLLHAHGLTFEHPVTHNQLRVESPVPTEFRF